MTVSGSSNECKSTMREKCAVLAKYGLWVLLSSFLLHFFVAASWLPSAAASGSTVVNLYYYLNVNHTPHWVRIRLNAVNKYTNTHILQ